GLPPNGPRPGRGEGPRQPTGATRRCGGQAPRPPTDARRADAGWTDAAAGEAVGRDGCRLASIRVSGPGVMRTFHPESSRRHYRLSVRSVGASGTDIPPARKMVPWDGSGEPSHGRSFPAGVIRHPRYGENPTMSSEIVFNCPCGERCRANAED